MNHIRIIKNIGIFLMLYTFMINTNANACEYPVKVTNGTDCKGVLLSDKQFIEVSNNKKKLRIQDIKIAQYEGMEELYEMRHEAYKKELRKTQNELEWMQIKSNFGYVISFSLGAVITGMIAKEVLD